MAQSSPAKACPILIALTIKKTTLIMVNNLLPRMRSDTKHLNKTDGTFLPESEYNQS